MPPDEAVNVIGTPLIRLFAESRTIAVMSAELLPVAVIEGTLLVTVTAAALLVPPVPPVWPGVANLLSPPPPPQATMASMPATTNALDKNLRITRPFKCLSLPVSPPISRR